MRYTLKFLTLLFAVATCFSLQAQTTYQLYGHWAQKAAYSDLGNANPTVVKTDDAGNVYIGGKFNGKMNFDPDKCSSLSGYDDISSDDGIYVVMYDKDGNYKWRVYFRMPLMTSGGLVLSDLAYVPGTKNIAVQITSASIYNEGLAGIKPIDAYHKNTKYTTLTVAGANCNIAYYIGNGGLFLVDVTKGEFVTHIQNECLYEGSILSAETGILQRTRFTNSNSNSYTDIYAVGANSLTLQSSKAYPSVIPGYNSVTAYNKAINGSLYTAFWKLASTSPYYSWESFLVKIDNSTVTIKKTIQSPSPNVRSLRHISSDNSSNIYSAYNSTYFTNNIMNLAQTGQNFYSATNANKAIIMKMDPDLNHLWSFQLGASNTSDVNKSTVGKIEVFDNKLFVVGSFTGTINFNPRGTEMTKTSVSEDGFYAIYDLNGICETLHVFSGGNNDSLGSLSVSSKDRVVLVGSFKSKDFQPDPAGRLLPFSSAGTKDISFVGVYSTNPASIPVPYPTSFADGPDSYNGSAVTAHYAYSCIRLNDIDFGKLQSTQTTSIYANTSNNDDAVIIPLSDGYVDLTNADFKHNTAGNTLSVKVSTHNSTADNANLIGWIDFNGNGKYDSIEASGVKIITANSGSSTVMLDWKNVNNQFKNGLTYMRLRLTTEQISAKQPTGLFLNGEVEDYALKFNIISIKKEDVKNKKIVIGDTVTYKITVNSKTPLDSLVVFDPIPSFTKYVAGSANLGGTLVKDPAMWGNTDFVRWRIDNFPANKDTTFTFKVILTEQPDTTIIINAAYALANKDTVSSVNNNCDFTITQVGNFTPQNDYFAVFKNDSILGGNISWNDPDPLRSVLRDTIIDTNTFQSGKATLTEPRDGTIKYNTPTGYLGIDSVDYQMKTASGSISDTARVYIAVVEPSGIFEKCPGETITIGMKPDDNSRLKYDWFRTPTGNTFIATGNTLPVTIGLNDTVFYVRVKIDNDTVTTARLPIQVKSIKCLDAADDLITMLDCSSGSNTIDIDVLANDIVGPYTVTPIHVSGTGPSLIGASVATAGNKLKYTVPCGNAGKTDEFKYRICTPSGSCDTATVKISILTPVSLTLCEPCSAAPRLEVSPVMADVNKYEWEKETTPGSNVWVVVGSDKYWYKPAITGSGNYRVKFEYNGLNITLIKTFTITKTITLPGGLIWYEAVIN